MSDWVKYHFSSSLDFGIFYTSNLIFSILYFAVSNRVQEFEFQKHVYGTCHCLYGIKLEVTKLCVPLKIKLHPTLKIQNLSENFIPANDTIVSRTHFFVRENKF